MLSTSRGTFGALPVIVKTSWTFVYSSNLLAPGPLSAHARQLDDGGRVVGAKFAAPLCHLDIRTGQQLARSEHATNITHNAIFTHSDTDTEQQLRSQQGEVTSRYNEAERGLAHQKYLCVIYSRS